VARHLGIPVTAVRIALVVLLSFNGLGLLLYAVFWAVLPQQLSTGARTRRDLALLLPFGAIGLGVVLLQGLLFGDNGVAGTAGWLIAVTAVGAGVIWHQSDPTRRGQLGDVGPQAPWLAAVVAESDRRSFLFRFIGGGILVAVGVIGILAVYAPAGNLSAVFNGVIFALVGLLGVGVVVAPLLWRTFSQLRSEREGRIREQERAEVAAMIHDHQRGAAAGPGPGAQPAQLALQAERVTDRAVRRGARAGFRGGRGHVRHLGGDGGCGRHAV